MFFPPLRSCDGKRCAHLAFKQAREHFPRRDYPLLLFVSRLACLSSLRENPATGSVTTPAPDKGSGLGLSPPQRWVHVDSRHLQSSLDLRVLGCVSCEDEAAFDKQHCSAQAAGSLARTETWNALAMIFNWMGLVAVTEINAFPMGLQKC